MTHNLPLQDLLVLPNNKPTAKMLEKSIHIKSIEEQALKRNEIRNVLQEKKM